MKNLKNQYYTKDIQLPNEKMQKLVASSYLKKSMKQVDNSDVNINHHTACDAVLKLGRWD